LTINVTVTLGDGDDRSVGFEAGLIAARILDEYPELSLSSTIFNDDEFEMYFEESE
jgi:hypothetical protein